MEQGIQVGEQSILAEIAMETHEENCDSAQTSRPQRARKQTEKMRLFQMEEVQKKERRLLSLYDKWKLDIRDARKRMKTYMSEEELWQLIENLKESNRGIMSVFDDIRDTATPSVEIRRRVDTCDAVTSEILSIAYDRAVDEKDDFDEDKEKCRMHELLSREYAHSVYGSAASLSNHSRSERESTASIAAKRMEAAAEWAAKKANYELMLEEGKKRLSIRKLEEQQKRDLEHQKFELDRLQAAREVSVAEVRLKTLKEMERENFGCPAAAVPRTDIVTTTDELVSDHVASVLPSTGYASVSSANPSAANAVIDTVPSASLPVGSITTSSLSSLVQVFQDNLVLNRLPVPEPFVFTGDPIQFIEWKAAFTALISKRIIDPAEKLYYLQKYVGGHAKQVLDGTFFRSDNEAYQDAWNRLNRRFGHPLTIQRAFRERINNWPKIHIKDAEGLRTYADFLSTCLEAIPHVEGLEILNDCEENQRLISKLPDWVAASWNRYVTQSLMEKNIFPSFKDFVSFITLEADIACNPVTSLHALHSANFCQDRKITTEMRKPRANILTTQVATNKRASTTAQGRPKPFCFFCKNDNHQLPWCAQFKDLSIIERRAFVKEKVLCYGCLKYGHIVKDCRQRQLCENCEGRHPTVLHDENFDRDESMVVDQEDNTATSLRVTVNENLLTSMVLPVWVSSKEDPTKEILVYALLDSQSDTTFIDQYVCDMLDTVKHTVKLKLTTMSATSMVVLSERVSGLCVRGYSSDIKIDLPITYTKDCIPLNRTHIPTCETAKRWSHLTKIMGDMQPLKDCEVGLLIGYNCSRVMAPRQVITGGDDEPYAIRTDLGWSIVGCTPQYGDAFENHICHRIVTTEQPPITPADVIHVLESDFRDVANDEETVSQEDIAFLDKVSNGIRQNEQGHYEMPLPFKKRPTLPNNKEMALIRLNHLKRKLLRDQTYKEQYIKYMEEVIEAGDAEEVVSEWSEGEIWYIPHHGVSHLKKPEKLRIVFDCSAKYKGTCLNDHLLSGPDLLNSLLGILIRFRQHPVAVMCDIEKMFHQFHVSEGDRNFLRFLWWKGGKLNSAPSEFRMKVHLFGAVSSPGCANYGLKHLAKEYNGSFPQASQFILRDFYVDDGLTSVESTSEAIKLAMEARELCAKGGLRLHKFLSNDRVVIDSIPESERAPNMKNLDLSFDNLPLERALGMQWNVEADEFTFSINCKDQPATRRGILSIVASLYDPLGFVAPVLLKAKTILQEMSRRGIAWDDAIPEELLPHWERWKEELTHLTKVTIPRTCAPVGFGKILRMELHHFSDASTKGYGQCSYLRLQNENGNIHCALVFGKSRVSPIKVMTIPRLELTAAVVAVQVSRLIKQEMRFSDMEEYFWTDSRVVLGYIKNEARRFHTFVANRVQKIHFGSLSEQWRYIPTEENPADHASRGLTPKELASSNWLTGPQFLWEKELVLPKDETLEPSIEDPEVRNAIVLDTESINCGEFVDRLSRFSSWSIAVRAVARILRRVKGNRGNHLSSVVEREQAERCIIKGLQKLVFKEEFQTLRSGKALSIRNQLYALDPVLDKEGILRLGGRLSYSLLDDSVKHPVILPRDHYLTRLIVAQCHENIKHQGKGLTINEIRANGYWIPGISRVVASYIYKCVICRRQRRPAEGQRMADLPQERVEPSPPFTYCGMDCFGPFITKQGRKENKRYGLLFTCLSSRAVHIEMLVDLSTDAFINGLRCFIAIRGLVRQIRCDQGTNFVGAKNEFAQALQELSMDRLVAFLANKQCDFVLNTPQSSHAGGVWERQIRTVRNILRVTVDLSKGLSDASLRTFFYEAMAIVNSRPITINTICHPNSLQPLTPNHLLTMKTGKALPPPGQFVREDIYSKKQWRQVQYLAEQFWSRWRKEYLANITLRQRWHKPQRNLKVGDIVMVKDDDAPRNEWRLGRVLETMPGKDGLVRKVRVQLGDRRSGQSGERLARISEIERPVQKLVVLVEVN